MYIIKLKKPILNMKKKGYFWANSSNIDAVSSSSSLAAEGGERFGGDAGTSGFFTSSSGLSKKLIEPERWGGGTIAGYVGGCTGLTTGAAPEETSAHAMPPVNRFPRSMISCFRALLRRNPFLVLTVQLAAGYGCFSCICLPRSTRKIREFDRHSELRQWI